MVGRSGRARSRRARLLLVVPALLVLTAAAAHAQCVGDCNGDGEVAINELILGVNIALGSQPVSACPAFANSRNEVDIAQLIKGVNNALDGCPATPTATSVPATATSIPTATGVPTGTATATVPPATPTHTQAPPATATATGVPTGTATATVPPSATVPATTTHTQPPPATATATGVPTGTATATISPTAATATSTPTATPTETSIPPGDAVAGRAAVVTTGLGGVQAMVGAIVSIITNDGSDLTFGLDDGVGGVADFDNCPLDGTTSQDCSGPNGGPLTISLRATNCVAAGPMGGEAEFDGVVTINANAGLFVQCGDPPVFFGGSLALDGLGVHFRDAVGQPLLGVTADLGGPFTLTPNLSSACLVGSLNMTLSGTLTSVLGDGSGVSVDFQNTGVVIDQITFNEDCVPIIYRLTFNGPATFTPMFADLSAGAPAPLGGVAQGESFAVTFTTFRIVQNATANPVTVTMTGSMTSDCFGGTLGLSTFTPVAVAAGQLCPASGAIDVTGGGTSARVTYDGGAVTVDPASGPPQAYPSCLDPALFVCAAS